MGKLNENTIIFNKNLFVGEPSDIASVIVVDYHIEAIILLEKLEDTDLIYTLLEARNKVLEELANE